MKVMNEGNGRNLFSKLDCFFLTITDGSLDYFNYFFYHYCYNYYGYDGIAFMSPVMFWLLFSFYNNIYFIHNYSFNCFIQ